ncbi:hypothetical protein GGI13_000597 [Coemansia sp. RSA 455]|nr:hypothetical protein GGI13_000597 [Coemansia sp. RSA 455]
MEERNIYTGAALRALSHEYNDDGAFPLVRALTLVLEPSESYESSESEHSDEPDEPVDMNEVYQTNVSAFLSWIKRMLPKVNDVNILIEGYTGLDDTLTQHFGRLVAQLYRLGSSVKYSSKDERDTLVASQLEEIRDLVHISFEDDFGCNQSSYLARRNLQTLQSLSLKLRYLLEAVSLIRNPDGGYVTYPCLHTLELWQHNTAMYSNLPVFPGAVPFPFLRSLRISLPALFGDNVLFRGNSATLESLVLNMDAEIVPALRQHSVFTPTSHQKLRRVILKRMDTLVPATFATYAEAIRFALSIGPGASVRGIEEVPSAGELLSALFLPSEYSSIRVLSIPDTELDIWQAISLIKSLPLLSDLYAPFPSIGSLPNGVTRTKLPEYMVPTYAPMGEKFRCWHLELYNDGVERMLLLALICPNFDYAAVSPPYRELFMAHMNVKIKSNGFRQHKERLQRMLFGGWENEFTTVAVAEARLAAV